VYKKQAGIVQFSVASCRAISASEMTYIVSGGALNSTHSLTPRHLSLLNQLSTDVAAAMSLFYAGTKFTHVCTAGCSNESNEVKQVTSARQVGRLDPEAAEF